MSNGSGTFGTIGQYIPFIKQHPNSTFVFYFGFCDGDYKLYNIDTTNDTSIKPIDVDESKISNMLSTMDNLSQNKNLKITMKTVDNQLKIIGINVDENDAGNDCNSGISTNYKAQIMEKAISAETNIANATRQFLSKRKAETIKRTKNDITSLIGIIQNIFTISDEKMVAATAAKKAEEEAAAAAAKKAEEEAAAAAKKAEEEVNSTWVDVNDTQATAEVVLTKISDQMRTISDDLANFYNQITGRWSTIVNARKNFKPELDEILQNYLTLKIEIGDNEDIVNEWFTQKKSEWISQDTNNKDNANRYSIEKISKLMDKYFSRLLHKPGWIETNFADKVIDGKIIFDNLSNFVETGEFTFLISPSGKPSNDKSSIEWYKNGEGKSLKYLDYDENSITEPDKNIIQTSPPPRKKKELPSYMHPTVSSQNQRKQGGSKTRKKRLTNKKTKKHSTTKHIRSHKKQDKSIHRISKRVIHKSKPRKYTLRIKSSRNNRTKKI